MLNLHGASYGNIRVSKYAVELDLFPPNIRDAAALAHNLEKEFGEVLTLRQLDLPAPAPTSSSDVIRSARSLFNEERFWEVHEEVEALWKTRKGEEKELLHGFILVAVAYVHLQKDERTIFLSVLRRAMRALAEKPEIYEGLDVQDLREKIQASLTGGNPGPFTV